MPTTRPRHVITETDDVAEALAEARRAWPDQNTNRLLYKLIQFGAHRLRQQHTDAMERRLEGLEELSSGEFAYEPGYLAKVREDWPA